MHQNMGRIDQARARGGIGGTLGGMLAKLDNGVTFLRLMLLPAKHDALPANCRLEPVW
jgi:magnesium-protoporphyrin IX monomethyl ester (oxidative) cyclase